MHNSDPIRPFAGETTKPHDLDLDDGHWLDWSTYEDERCGGIITHIKSDKLYQEQLASLKSTGHYDEETAKFYRFCQGAFTIKGTKWNLTEPDRANWTMTGTYENPTLAPSFLCHCGDHGFIREGKWVRA